MKIFSTSKDNMWFEPQQDGGKINTNLNWGEKTGDVWEGFGGCFNELSQIALLELKDSDREKVYDNLFSKDVDGLKFDFCRIPIGASDYAEIWYSHNETEGDFEMKEFSIERDKKYLIPYIKEALKRNPNMKFFASPWSPPTWMKTPKRYNGGVLTWTEENLKAYALYLAKFVEAYKEEGINITQLHVQNEPMSEQKFPSCFWDGQQFAEFIGKYLGPLFDERGIDTEIWLGTLNGPETDWRMLFTRYNQYANVVLNDEDAYKYVKGISYQWAGKNATRQTKESFPEKRMIQSENECGDGENTWEYAKYIYELFRKYITDGVCAYVYWNMVLKPHGVSTWGWPQNSMITIDDNHNVIYNYEYYLMKHFAGFVRKGARVITLTGHLTANAVAFENDNGQKILVAQNPFDYKLTFELEGNTITLPEDSINTIIL